jgi:hypothetical protein
MTCLCHKLISLVTRRMYVVQEPNYTTLFSYKIQIFSSDITVPTLALKNFKMTHPCCIINYIYYKVYHYTQLYSTK